MTLPKTATTLFASVAALAMLPAMAASTTGGTVKTIDVSVAGFDLTDANDAKVVLSKIKRAAKRVCRNSNATRSVRERAEELACQSAAIAGAVTKVNVPQLTAAMEADNSSS
ncbi:MAG: UrcA family protein [Henriciella sp.]|nr:UrcA family protein [Henriciella sp.]